jgi:hypothetical protein
MTDVPLDIVTGIGSCAVAAALGYAAVQTRTVREQLKLARHQAENALTTHHAANDLALMTHILSLDRLFVEHPELRKYFYERVPVPTEEPMRSRVLSTAELVIDTAEAVTNLIRLKQLTPQDEAIWTAALEFYGRSPAVREAFEGLNACWRAETRAFLFGVQDKSEESNPIPYKVA